MPNPNDPYRPDLPYRCPDCVTTGEEECSHPRPTIAQVERGAYEKPREPRQAS